MMASALLIDLENFFIGREGNYQRTHADDLYEFAVDLDSLCSFASDVAAGRRLVARRAYANFNDRRPGDGDRRWDYYLQPLPRFLMEQGVEPVQVFRFPGGSNKNAADMRLAMDAASLLNGPTDIDQFILVTGDSDFIPLVLELKLRGAEVVVIGVTGCTKSIFARYCDRFEYFEDLLAARELRREDESELQPIREALVRLLARRTPIKFAAVKPLLGDELGRPFDPTRFNCETTGEFLRRYCVKLELGVRRGEHDWEIAPRGTESFSDASEELPEANDESGSIPRVPERVDGDAPRDVLYRDLLRQGIPRCYVVPYTDWTAIAGAVFRVATEGTPGRPIIHHQDLLAEAIEICQAEGMVDAQRKVRDGTFQLFKAGCFHCADDDAESGQIDFHWSRGARLDPEITSAHDLTRRNWAFLVRVLVRRLAQRGLSEHVDVDSLADVLAGPDASPENRMIVEELAGDAVDRK